MPRNLCSNIKPASILTAGAYSSQSGRVPKTPKQPGSKESVDRCEKQQLAGVGYRTRGRKSKNKPYWSIDLIHSCILHPNPYPSHAS